MTKHSNGQTFCRCGHRRRFHKDHGYIKALYRGFATPKLWGACSKCAAAVTSMKDTWCLRFVRSNRPDRYWIEAAK